LGNNHACMDRTGNNHACIDRVGNSHACIDRMGNSHACIDRVAIRSLAAGRTFMGEQQATESIVEKSQKDHVLCCLR
jgi:hypothetical protein